MATALTFSLFLPGIIEQGAFTYHAATGLTQEPFLGRWLLLVAGFYLISAGLLRGAQRHDQDSSRSPSDSMSSLLAE